MMAGIVHGGGLTAACARYGGEPGDWLDLSTGINPNMVALPEIPTAVWNRLPDAALELAAREAARDWYLPERGTSPSVLPDISPSRGEIDSLPAPRSNAEIEDVANLGWLGAVGEPHTISPLEGEMPGRAEGGDAAHSTGNLPLPVPGTQSFIQILPKLVPADRPVAILSPTYGEYAHCFRRAGMVVDAIGSLDELTDEQGTLVIVNPNNPTGGTFLRQELTGLAARMRQQGGHLHVDEAFGDARPELSLAALAGETPGVTVSRSFGKFFGLAGLRLGFVFAVPEALETIEAELGPWAVSGPALYLAHELMQGDRMRILSEILARRAALASILDAAGLETVGGTELFALVRQNRAQDLFEHLARLHILVRKFDYAGDWLRIGLAPDEQGDRRLAQALASARD
ncbi:threonine-phosphate decarboxylase [Rhizobium sp. LjRoot254]|uniref:threonine-phosphate decarboxylase n=1 Tax=Rhizobium sp. LjRoot254 TaxID=3342297 RepID=UPI003ECFD418